MSDAPKKLKAAREPGSKPVHKARPPRKITTGYRASVYLSRECPPQR
ncbi:MAG: hypothetical protein ABSB63_06610 [Spirochaetia bacterium]